MDTKEKEALKKKWEVVSLEAIQSNYNDMKEAAYVTALTIQENKFTNAIGVEEVFLSSSVVKIGIIMDIFGIHPFGIEKELYQDFFDLFSSEVHNFDISPYKVDYIEVTNKEGEHMEDTLHIAFSYTGDNKRVLRFLEERAKNL